MILGLGVLFILLSVQFYRAEDNEVLQPYGPKMCEARCRTHGCLLLQFDDINLTCQLHVNKNNINHNTSNFDGLTSGRSVISSLGQRVSGSLTKLSSSSGFFLLTVTEMFYITPLLTLHVVNVRGCRWNRFYYHDRRFYHLNNHGVLKAGLYNNRIVNFRRYRFIKELINYEIAMFALDGKKKVLAVSVNFKFVKMLDLNGKRPKQIFKAKCFSGNLQLDTEERILFYLSQVKKLISVDYKGQTMNIFKDKMYIDSAFLVEFKAYNTYCYTCVRGRLVRYSSEKRQRIRRYNLNREKMSCTYWEKLFTFNNKILINVFSNIRKGLMVIDGNATYWLWLNDSFITDLIKIQ